MKPRLIIPAIVSQHVEDAASLRSTRSVLVRAPHVRLLHLGRIDERLRAHLDGIRVAADDGYRMAQAALELPSVGQLFAVAVTAIERRDLDQLQRLLALAGVAPDAERALASAFGWVAAPALRGLTSSLLAAGDSPQRWLGIAACAAHGVDPGVMLSTAVGDAGSALRSRALRAAGQLGRVDLLDRCVALCASDLDPACRFQAAWAARLLGEREHAAQSLLSIALQPGPFALEALQIVLLGAEPADARAAIRRLAADGTSLRSTIRATGWAGDVRAVPWLINQMADGVHTRIAGEAFTLLTGADLARLDLERKPPEQADGESAQDPGADAIELDDDDSLPWPDISRIQSWWAANAARMPIHGRCLMGAQADENHCLRVLREGAQRQRRCAALLLKLRQPERVLFNVAAPAWRQDRLLAQMTSP